MRREREAWREQRNGSARRARVSRERRAAQKIGPGGPRSRCQGPVASSSKYTNNSWAQLATNTACSIVRLWQQQDKKTEAHATLSEVYHWFTEGFETKDLLEAKALLEELS
jgi:predicted ATPase